MGMLTQTIAQPTGSPRSKMGTIPSRNTNGVRPLGTALLGGSARCYRGVAADEATGSQAVAEIDRLIRYLLRHQERPDYRFASKRGYPMGSGGIKSAHKFVCHVQLNRSAAWFSVTNANQILALRCAKYNGTFDRVFDRFREQVQKQSWRKLLKNEQYTHQRLSKPAWASDSINDYGDAVALTHAIPWD